MKYLSPLVLY